MSLLTVTHGLVGRTPWAVQSLAHTGVVANFVVVENPQGWGLSTSELISGGVVVLSQDTVATLSLPSHPADPLPVPLLFFPFSIFHIPLEDSWASALVLSAGKHLLPLTGHTFPSESSDGVSTLQGPPTPGLCGPIPQELYSTLVTGYRRDGSHL